MTVASPQRQRKHKVASGKRPEAHALLAWYDRHRRVLPWRAAAGETADPYRVWLSEIMLQQTTVKAVAPYFLRFTARWPNVEALAAAPLDDVLRTWAGLGYYARARNLHACARAVVERRGGQFPSSETELGALPGIGRYTAAAIAAIVERVVARLYAVDKALPAAKPDIQELAQGLAPQERGGDFAQGLMDLGATICTPKKPACVLCPWTDACAARARGHPETFPVKTPKPEGRRRRGAAFVILRADGCVLVRSRPPKGLLGGMTEVPTTAWTHDFEDASALNEAPKLARARWRRIPGVVTHVFTHFPLDLIVYATQVPVSTRAPRSARWVALADLAGEALPNLMRKVVAHALDDRRTG
jgi:A/G-specific adenine glycosylase